MRILCFILLLWHFLVPVSLRVQAQGESVRLPTGAVLQNPSLVFEGDRFRFSYGLDHLDALPEKGGDYVSLMIRGFYPDGKEGSPALPKLSMLFEAAEGEVTGVVIQSLDSVVIDLGKEGIQRKLSPAVPSVRKGIPFPGITVDNEVYDSDTWIGDDLIHINYEGILRGLPMSTLQVSPVRYNPAKNLLKIYYHLECTLQTTGPSRSRVLPGSAFNELYGRVAKRTTGGTTKSVLAERPMTLVILSDTLFRSTLRPFVEWKTRKGFRVVEVYREDPEVGGTPTAIKSYLHSLFEDGIESDSPPEYLLIVGDVEYIPESQPGGQVTDLYYTTFDGEGDYIPDMYYGRISANSPPQLESILEKILEYEQFLFPDPGFLDKSVLIAGVDDSYASLYGNGQINYAHHLYLNESIGHQANLFLYPESDTGAQAILQLISSGVGFVNYTGHGLYDRWIDPPFHQNDISGLENLGAYPVMIGNGCETNIFTLSECFAEALLRAPGKGALAYIGCTNDSYWKEDYYWSVGVGPILADPEYTQTTPGYYDRVFHTHGESRDLWTPSLGEMVFGGNMSVQESNSARKKFYWEIYQLAGDPTLIPWFVQPGSREVEYPAMIPPGVNRLDLTCSPFDYAAVSMNGSLLDAAHASANGSLTLYLPDSLSADTVDLVVTGDKYRPFIAKIPVGFPAGPYPQLNAYSLGNESVEPDHRITPGEEFSLDMVWINRGLEPLSTDTLVLKSADEHLEVIDSLVRIGPLGKGDTVSIQDAFRVAVRGELNDQAPLSMEISRQGDPTNQPFYLNEKAAAPDLYSGGIRWDDRPFGNGNGIVEKGEWLTMEWLVYNRGHFKSGGVLPDLSGASRWAISGIESGSPEIIGRGDSIYIRFLAATSLDPSTVPQTVKFLAGDQNVSVTDSFTLFTGRHYEDFSDREPAAYDLVNESESPWVMDTVTFRSSPRSFRSGAVGNYGKSDFALTIEMEEADSLSFSYRVSSESSYDFLKFYVDSVPVMSWSGERGWERFGLLLDAGSHNVRWSYQKDISLSRGMDAAWVDDILFPASAFTGTDLSLMEITSPESGPWLGEAEEVHLLVRNTGDQTIDDFLVRLTGPFEETIEEWISVPVPAGEETDIVLSHLLDLSGMQTHELEVNIIVDSDQYLGNNSLRKQVVHTLFPDLSLVLEGMESEDGIFANAIVDIVNSGNTVLDSFRYEIAVNGTVRDQGSVWIGLPPGDMLTDTLRILDPEQTALSTGFYHYEIRSLDTDSVPGNHLLEGDLFWQALGLVEAFPPEEWDLYPNPASGSVFLRAGQPLEEPVWVELIGANGETAVHTMFQKGQQILEIPVRGLAGGHYFVRINGRLALPLVILE